MKTVCTPGYHQNYFAAAHALRHMTYSPQSNCGDNREDTLFS